MSAPTYASPARYEVLRAISIGVTVAGTGGLLLMGSSLVEGDDHLPGLGALVVFAVGVGCLLWSRARLVAIWTHNRPYLLSDQGSALVRARREHVSRVLWLGRALLALFVVTAVVFFVLFNAIACGDRVDGFCGQVGRPPEWLVTVVQMVAFMSGCAWAAVVYWRRRQDDETDRIELVVAEGHRRRRIADPLADAKRATWD